MEQTYQAPDPSGRERFTSAHFGDRVLGDLVDLIGRLDPGDRLPSERELSLQLSVSRTALRDRIGRLESLGILERREREGTIYTGLKPERMGEVLVLGLVSSQMHVDSLVTVRQALEQQAAILASRSPRPEGLLAMRSALHRMMTSDDGRELYDADNAFHTGLFQASNNPGLTFFSEALHVVLRGTLRHVVLAEERETLREIHTAVYEAIEAGDETAVTRAMEWHFSWLEELFAKESGHPTARA